MEQVKNKKKGIIISGISAIVLIAVLGVTFAIWNYSRTTDNQILVAGDVYMKFKESPALTIENAIPSEGPGEKYFEFTIEGKNTYSKPIWYEIDLQHGEDHETRKTRIEDSLLKFRLVEIKDGNEQTVVDNASYSDLTNKKIWVNTIPAGTKTKVEITYRLYMWISSETIIGNTEDAIYDIETWNNDVYASIKVNVTGDFNEKEIKKEIQYGIGTNVVKDTIGQAGGVIGVKSDNTSTTNKDDEVREYRYSGPSVNNYIYFNCSEETTYETAKSNCEMWRIIGVFKDESGKEHLKIVRNEILTGIPATYMKNGIEYNLVGGNTAAWNRVGSSSKNNDWATAGLQYWLNTTQDETAETPNKGYLSTLKGNALSMIEETKYYLGTVTADSSSFPIIDTPKEAYANERDVESCEENTGKDKSESGCKVWANNQATWTGKVALMYPSDYGFSVNNENDNWDKQLKDFSTIKSSSWLNSANPSSIEWLLSPSSGNSARVAYWAGDGIVSSNDAIGFYLVRVRPSVNLISDIKITQGDGTSENPYFLEI